ncbi:MORN_motif [Hexamita inflata]|uniref:MORN motif n=1 Tax=Hexamita inflata TaxID=28002 RepID=A0AA86P7N8_9EUKA|nr:MORN motif [Hexamita inflata]
MILIYVDKFQCSLHLYNNIDNCLQPYIFSCITGYSSKNDQTVTSCKNNSPIKNGSIYEGEFYNNQPEGTGKLTFANQLLSRRLHLISLLVLICFCSLIITDKQQPQKTIEIIEY